MASSSTGTDSDTVPPPEHRLVSSFFNTTLTRRKIIASYCVILVLCVPFWWYTTSIQRLALPTGKIEAEAQRGSRFRVDIGISWFPSESLTWDTFHPSLKKAVRGCEAANDIEFQFVNAWRSEMPPNLRIRLREGTGSNHLSEENASVLDFYVPKGQKARLHNDLATLICDLLAPSVSAHEEHRTVQYSSRYRLSFSLMNENAEPDHSILQWDAKLAIRDIIEPVVERLKPLHNFSIESQLQVQAPLAFTVERASDDYSVVSREQLTVFVNSAEWTVSSAITNDPVLHFLIFVPSKEHSPLYVEGLPVDPNVVNSFIVPRWGGILILNPTPEQIASQSLDYDSLYEPFQVIRSQLLQLLGAPSHPLYQSATADDANVAISEWQLDTLMRRRAKENVKGSREALLSIVRLVNSIRNMPVGPVVQSGVEEALKRLNKIHEEGPMHAKDSVQNSAQAFEISSRAFFHPTMLAMLYFPAEHTFAVYLPLFGVTLVPIIVAALKELRAWKKERKELEEARKVKSQ